MIQNPIRIVIFIMILFVSAGLRASSTDIDQYYPDFKADNDMRLDNIIRNSSQKGIQLGGFFSPSFAYYQERSKESIGTNINTMHIWLKAYLADTLYFYIRGKEVLSIKTNSEGSEYDSIDTVDNLLDLDLAFLRYYNESQSINISLGRKHFLLGTGIVFNGRADGVELRFDSSVIDIMFFSAYTGLLQKENNPYYLNSNDTSDGAERLFAGGTTEFDFYNQTAYLLGMAQYDFHKEDNDDRCRYFSQYYGLGMRGVIFGSVTYFGEFVYETGKSYTSTQNSDNSIQDIRAYAYNIGLEKYFDTTMNPVLLFQYAFGSGDKDRYSYSGSTGATGNTDGDDHGFIGFGSFSGGYALRPVLSNLHIVRFGFALTPFSDREDNLQRFVLISKFSVYVKDEKQSAVNDGAIDLEVDRNAFVGLGIDVALRWKIYYDLSFFINYATIIPDETYEIALDNRHLLLSGIVLSF